MDNKKKIAVASLTMSLLSLVPVIISPESLTGTMAFVAVGILFAIVGVILGFIGKSASKGLSISGIVIGIISFGFLCMALVGFMAIKNVTDCVDNGDQTSTCNYMGVEIEVPNGMLSEEQMKKVGMSINE